MYMSNTQKDGIQSVTQIVQLAKNLDCTWKRSMFFNSAMSKSCLLLLLFDSSIKLPEITLILRRPKAAVKKIMSHPTFQFVIVINIVPLLLNPLLIGISHSVTSPGEVFGQSEDEDNKTNDFESVSEGDSDNNDNNQDNKAKYAILTFDDGYKSQYTTAKPILDKYGYKATFYIVCNYAQKIDADRMNWTEVKKLYAEGHDIGSHTMNHHDLTQIPPYRIDYEIGISKQCLLANGIKNVTSFAYPFAEGSTNATIINTVAKHYSIGRSADAPLMFLDCDGWDNDNEDGYDDISFTFDSSNNQDNCKASSADEINRNLA